jgi:hypothetical protein
MYCWGGVIGQVRRAALTACAASFFTLIAFLIFRSPEPQSSSTYLGVWITLPAADAGSDRLASAELGEGLSQQRRENKTTTSPTFDQVREAVTTATPSTQAASSALVVSGVSQVPGLEVDDKEPPQSSGISPTSTASTAVEKPLVPVSTQEADQHDGPLFAINLESTLQPTDPSAVMTHRGFESHRLYVTRFEKDGQIWHRLRLGFFPSEKTAQQALAKMRLVYPDAWVTHIPPEEVMTSVGSAIHEPPSYTNSPTLLVEAAPEPLIEPLDAGSSHLNLTIPEILTGTSVAVGSFEEQQGEPETDPQAASDSSLVESQTAYNSVPDSSGSASPGFRFRDSPYKPSPRELAQIQRWQVSNEGTPAATEDGLVFAQTGESEFSGETFGLTEVSPTFGKEDEWEQHTSLISDLQLSNSARVTLGHSYSGSRSREYENFGAEFVGLSNDWEEDTLNNTALKVGLWGDRLELTSLHSLSRHDEVVQGDDAVMGHGIFQGLDADLLSGESFSLSISGSYGIADDAYGSSEDDDDDVPGAGTEAMDYGLEAGFALGFADLSLTHEKTWKTEDIDEDYQNLVSSDYMVGLGIDSLDLMLSYNQSSETEGRDEDRERETSVGYEAEAEYEVQALRGLLGDPFGPAFWDYAPSSISLGYGVRESKSSDGERAETTEVNVGASWSFDGGWAGIGYSHSFEDDVGSNDSDKRVEGVWMGGALDKDNFSVEAGLWMDRTVGFGQSNEYKEHSFSPTLELSHEPGHWPDLSVSGSASYSQGDYFSDGGTSMSQSWEVLTELDFAKFWPEVLDSEDEGMLLVFQLKGDSSREKWGDDVSGDSSLDYFVGFKVDLTLGE